MDKKFGSAEWDDAPRLEKFHRYAIGYRGIGFGLRDTQGVTHRFTGEVAIVSGIAEELTQIASAARYIARTGSVAGHISMNAGIAVERTSDGRIAPFIGVSMKLLRAEGLLDQLNDLLERFATRAKFFADKVSETESATTYRIRIDPLPPFSIPLLIGEVAHHARSALDILINDIARIRGITGDRLKFPFAATPQNLAGILRTDIAPLGSDLVTAIEDLKPYAGGNAVLYGLHELNIIDKHRMVVPAFASVHRRYDLEGVVNRRRALDDLPPVSMNVLGTGWNSGEIRDGDLVTCGPGETPFDSYLKDEVGVEARFPSDCGPFPSKDVVTTLNRLLQCSSQICGEFSIRFATQP